MTIDLDRDLAAAFEMLQAHADEPDMIEIRNFTFLEEAYVAGRVRMYRDETGRLIFESTPDGPMPDGPL